MHTTLGGPCYITLRKFVSNDFMQMLSGILGCSAAAVTIEHRVVRQATPV